MAHATGTHEDDKTDADCLREAAWVLHTRAKRKTFALRVVIRVLQIRADRIEHPPPETPDVLRAGL